MKLTATATATTTDRQAAEDYCLAHDLPLSGFVLFFNGNPFQWQATNPPNPPAVMPGVIAVAVDGDSRFVACGGNAEIGARWWRRED